ncbi:MAG TPA: hypothetical protein VHO90_07000 [Bacteroidales bacterium]|nr:hypothetical protein [Bacteroidales bacterium]
MKQILFLVFSGLLIISCKEGSNPKFITGINADGSCYKEIVAKGDSAFIVGDTAKSNPFQVELDSSWQITWSYISPEIHNDWPLKEWKWDTTHKDSPMLVKARKEYNSVKEMDSLFKLHPKHPWRNFTPDCKLEKKFRWFYTYYSYSENYQKINTFHRIPIEKYMSKEEAEFWFNGKLDLIKGMTGIEINDEAQRIEEKFNRWFIHNILDAQYDALLEKYDSIKGIKIEKQKLITYKDSALEYCISYLHKDKDIDLTTYLDKYFKTGVFSKYNANNKLKEVEDKILSEFIGYFDPSMDYNLIMPGEILYSDNIINKGDTLAVNLTAYRMVYSNYRIAATSRKPNTWAFVVTGIIVLLAVGSFFIRKK